MSNGWSHGLRRAATLASVVVLAAACGSSATSQAPGSAAASQAASSQPASSTAASAASTSCQGAKITMWVPGGNETGPNNQIQNIKDKLGIDLTISVFPYNDLYTKGLAAAKAGSGLPDVMMSDLVWTGAYVAAKAYKPITPFLNNTALADPNYDLADFSAESLANYGQWDGVQYGIPWWAVGQSMFYRTDVISAPPKTWDEFAQTAQKVQTSSFWMVALTAQNGSQIIHPFDNRLASFGGNWIDAQKNITVNSDAGVKALDLLKEQLAKYADPNSPSYGYAEDENAFVTGRTATSEFWNDMNAMAQDATKSKIVGKVGMAQIPAGTQNSSTMGGWFLSVTTQSANKDCAFKVVEYLTSKDPLIQQGLDAGISSGRASFYKDPQILAKYPGIDIMPTVIKNGTYRPNIPEYFQMADILGNAISDAVVNKTDSKTALDSVVTQWTPLLAHYH